MKLFRKKKGKCVDDFLFLKDTTFAYRKTIEIIKAIFFSDNKLSLRGTKSSFVSQNLSVEPIMGNFYPCQCFVVEVSNEEESVKVLYEILATPFYCNIKIKDIKSDLENIYEEDILKSFNRSKELYGKEFSRKWRGILKKEFNNPKYVEACKEYFEFVKQEKDNKAYAECADACNKNKSEYDEEVNKLLNL